MDVKISSCTASADLILPRQAFDCLPHWTIDSLPRQRLPNLTVGLNPRLGSEQTASRSDARIRPSLRDGIVDYVSVG